MLAGEQPEGHHAVYAYGGAVAVAIVRLKYAGRSDLADRLGQVLGSAACSSLDGHASQTDLVVPVPLHPRRLVERGFDQAALLAAPVADALDVAYAPRALVRTQDTPRQASLDRNARASNVAVAFAVRSREGIAGRRVLLVDDVRTTGATLASCAETLLQGGARGVRTLVLASRERDRQG